MTATLVIIVIPFGALWRRAFGGWLGMSRVLLVCLGTLSAVSLGYLAWGPDWRLIVLAAGWAWLWTDGHDFHPATWRGLGYRYLGPAATIAALTSMPLLVLIGPAVFAAYWLTERFWPPAWTFGEIIDGHSSAAELLAGAAAFGLLAGALSTN